MTQKRITDDLHALLGVLPLDLAEAVTRLNNSDNLLEIILDLGRVPLARFVDGEKQLSEGEISREEIDFVTARIGEFDADNRAGLERTLHRISAIRNRRGHIVGLTCRVGRAVYGTIDIIQDLIESERVSCCWADRASARPPCCARRARMLAEKKRVIIVDTSNEIGGDGDVPHPAVGQARRMQVRMPNLQHEVMIEAVENHNPEVIVIDEIGRELEAAAARTIAERGVQLIATAHGRTLENLLLNPTLSDLIGGIESVTLSDEEAHRRGTQKTVLERRSPPTFDILVEIAERDRLVIYADVAAAVDDLVRGYPLHPEIRSRDAEGKIHIEKATTAAPVRKQTPQGQRRQLTGETISLSAETVEEINHGPQRTLKSMHIFAYGVARNRLTQAAKRLGVPAVLVNEASEADAVMTLRTYYRNHQQTIQDAEDRGTPIYVLRANTVSQMEQSLAEMFNLGQVLPSDLDMHAASLQAQQAIEAVLNGQRYIDLPAAGSAIRRMQHDMAREAQLVSHSYGKEPHRYVRIFKE